MLGLVGAFLLCVCLAPVAFSEDNTAVMAEWRDIILAWTGISGYLRLGFVVISVGIVSLGFLGVLVSFFKPESGKKFMLWGGVSSILLLLALWIGFLDLHLPLLGRATNLMSALKWDEQWGVGNWKLARQIIEFGNGWLKPVVVGGALLVAASIPRWWAHSR